jgi:outer membrane protein TolC
MKTVGRKPPVREAEISLRNHQIAETFTRSNLRPTFSVFAEVNSLTLGPGVSDMFRQTVRYAYPEYAIGFTLSVSVKNRAAQADNVRARLELHQAQVILDQAKANAALNIRTAITNLDPRRSEVEAAENAVTANEQTADAEQVRWSEGYSTLDKVYQAQQDLVRAQTAAIQSRLNYAKALHSSQSAAGTFNLIHGIVPEDALKGSLWKGPLPN